MQCMFPATHYSLNTHMLYHRNMLLMISGGKSRESKPVVIQDTTCSVKRIQFPHLTLTLTDPQVNLFLNVSSALDFAFSPYYISLYAPPIMNEECVNRISYDIVHKHAREKYTSSTLSFISGILSTSHREPSCGPPRRLSNDLHAFLLSSYLSLQNFW